MARRSDAGAYWISGVLCSLELVHGPDQRVCEVRAFGVSTAKVHQVRGLEAPAGAALGAKQRDKRESVAVLGGPVQVAEVGLPAGVAADVVARVAVSGCREG